MRGRARGEDGAAGQRSGRSTCPAALRGPLHTSAAPAPSSPAPPSPRTRRHHTEWCVVRGGCVPMRGAERARGGLRLHLPDRTACIHARPLHARQTTRQMAMGRRSVQPEDNPDKDNNNDMISSPGGTQRSSNPGRWAGLNEQGLGAMRVHVSSSSRFPGWWPTHLGQERLVAAHAPMWRTHPHTLHTHMHTVRSLIRQQSCIECLLGVYVLGGSKP